MAEFIYQEPFPIQDDKTKYRLLTKEYVKVVECDGRKILKLSLIHISEPTRRS